jgi:TonB family protein
MRGVLSLVVGFSLAVGVLLGQTRLIPEEADKLAIESPNPRYPADAKYARIQGAVVLDVTVSESGSVIATKLVLGHPLLADAAAKAARKRTYRPYLADGKPVAFVTIVGTTFTIESLHLPEQDLSRGYLAEQNGCRTATDEHNWSDAESACSGALWLAGQLAGHDGIERIVANNDIGFVYLAQQRFDEALKYFSHALAIADKRTGKTDTELAYVYRNLAFAEQGLGHLGTAREYYSKAEATLEAAQANIRDDGLKLRCAKTLKSVLKFHLAAALQAGATQEAEEIQKRLNALP